MYVTPRSFAAPAPATRDFFWLYHTYSLLRGGFYNASSGFGLDFRSRPILSLSSLIEDTSQIPLLFQLKIEERPFPVTMVFYITISGDIAINGHKKNSLIG